MTVRVPPDVPAPIQNVEPRLVEWLRIMRNAVVSLIRDNAAGGMVPPGGATSTVLGKTTAADFDTSWIGPMLPLTGGTLTGGLTITPASGASNITLSSPGGAGNARNIWGNTGSSNRWQLVIASGATETGIGNTGSDFVLNRYTDAGAFIDAPLTINRATGVVAVLSGAVNSGLAINGVTGSYRILNFFTSGVNRWNIIANNTAEGGANAGTDLNIQAYTDAGAFLATPIAIKRSTGVCTFSAAIVNGPSDRSLKENIAPLEGSLDKVQQLKGVSFNFIKDDAKRRQIGLVAQDVAPIVPEVMQDFIQPDEEPKLAIDYTRLVPLLVEAIKELTAKVARLEAFEARLSPGKH